METLTVTLEPEFSAEKIDRSEVVISMQEGSQNSGESD